MTTLPLDEVVDLSEKINHKSLKEAISSELNKQGFKISMFNSHEINNICKKVNITIVVMPAD